MWGHSGNPFSVSFDTHPPSCSGVGIWIQVRRLGDDERREEMKRSGSDWYLDQLLRPVEEAGGEVVDGNPTDAVAALGGLLLPGASQKHRGGCGGGVPFADIYCDDLGFEFGDREAISSHPTGGPLGGGDMWSQKHSSVSATIESHSSICENQALGGSSGSDQSDDESLEIDAGSCELGTDVLDIKRMRRMVSNRESARRSRKRKQAHLADLELQVDQLRGENATLYKQLTDANHQFGDAVTNNRVLKSDVEALRVKVKMAEDLVTRGSLACGLDHLLQNSIASNQLLNVRHLARASEISPIMEILQADDACFISGSASAQAQSMASLENLQSRISSEVTSCGGDMWPWDSPTINVISKQL